MKDLFGYFWRGCLVLAPVGVTLYVAYWVFKTIDSVIPVPIPGLGFVLTLGLITLVGFLTSNVVGKAVVRQLERALARVPLLELLYTSIRDLIGAFVGNKKRFDRPVSVALVPGSSARALGFVTREALTPLRLEDHVAVYFPQSYNFAGNVLVVPRDQVDTVEASSADVMAFIVSGGISGLGVGAHGASIPPPSPAGVSPTTTLIMEPKQKDRPR